MSGNRNFIILINTIKEGCLSEINQQLDSYENPAPGYYMQFSYTEDEKTFFYYNHHHSYSDTTSMTSQYSTKDGTVYARHIKHQEIIEANRIYLKRIINFKDADHNTALMYAACHGDLDIIKALIRVGAKVQFSDYESALKNKHYEIAYILYKLSNDQLKLTFHHEDLNDLIKDREDFNKFIKMDNVQKQIHEDAIISFKQAIRDIPSSLFKKHSDDAKSAASKCVAALEGKAIDLTKEEVKQLNKDSKSNQLTPIFRKFSLLCPELETFNQNIKDFVKEDIHEENNSKKRNSWLSCVS